jgi:hypothetical protein
LGVAVLWRRSPSAAAVALLLLLHAVAVYSSPQFSVTRLGWSQFNGRYFLLPLALATCLGWLAAGERARAYAGFLAVAVAFDLWVYGALRWSPREVSLLLQHLALLAGTLALVLSVARRGPAWRLGLAVALAAVFVGYGELRRIGERTQLMSEGVSGHVVEKYWIPAARAVDSRREHYRIAVTSGPWQKADNWFLYPFLGSHLQNTLSYVPPSRSGRVLPFAEQVLHPDLDRAAWLERLDRGGIDAVMSFAPPGPELEWMQGDRARFVRITGEDATWGLYLVLRRTAP